MKLWTVVLLSAVLATAAALYCLSVGTPLSIGGVLFPYVSGSSIIAKVGVAVVAGSVIYGIVVTALSACSIILEMLAAMDALRFAGSSGNHMLRRDWEAAFNGEVLKSVRYRIVAPFPLTEDERLLLAAPFSPAAARKEFRSVYFRRLAITQVWGIIVALLIYGAVAAEFFRDDTTLVLLHRILLGEAVVIAIVTMSWLAVIIAIDTISSVLAETRFLLNPSQAVLSDWRLERSSNADYGANAIAGTVRSEIESVVMKLNDLCLANFERASVARLPQALTEALSTALEQRLREALSVMEKAVVATASFLRELPLSIAEASEDLLRRLFTDHIEAIRIAGGAIVEEQKTLGEKVEELGRIVARGYDLQVEVPRQLAADVNEVHERLHAVFREVSAQAVQEREAAVHSTGELVRSVEAYAASLLPAIKRLESYDERVLRAMNQKSETLTHLTMSVSELSGILEAMRVQLGLGAARGSAPTERSGPTSMQPNANGHDNLSGLGAELRSLLNDLDDDHPSDKATPDL